MTEVDEDIRAVNDDKVDSAIGYSESGKLTFCELVRDTGIKVSVLQAHIESMKSRGLLTSHTNDLNGEIYYKLACG